MFCHAFYEITDDMFLYNLISPLYGNNKFMVSKYNSAYALYPLMSPHNGKIKIWKWKAYGIFIQSSLALRVSFQIM